MGAKSKASPVKTIELEKPASKLAYKVGEVARMTGASVEDLEAWEKEFPFLNAGRTGSGRKFFRQGDVDIIRRIQELVSAKNLTLAGIKRQIEKEFGLASPESVHPDKLRKALYSLRDELSQLATSLGKDEGKK